MATGSEEYDVVDYGDDAAGNGTDSTGGTDEVTTSTIPTTTHSDSSTNAPFLFALIPAAIVAIYQ